MQNEDINGLTMHYSESGRGRRVLLVHGYPLNSRMWAAQVAALSDQCRVIAPDLRGFGASKSDGAFSMESLAGDLHKFLTKIDALPAVIAGFSMGGYVALAHAMKHSSDLAALVLIDTRAEADSVEGKQNRNKQIDLVRTAGAAAVAEQMLPKLFAEQSIRSSFDAVGAAREMIESTSIKTIENALVAMRDREDQIPNLPAISVPTLILVGEHDAITTPAMAQRMHELISGSKLAIIPEAGHMSPMENPQAVSTEIREFLRSLPNL